MTYIAYDIQSTFFRRLLYSFGVQTSTLLKYDTR